MTSTPILSAMLQTIRYHMGTIAKGSFIITLVKIPRLILTYIHSQLKGKVSPEVYLFQRVYLATYNFIFLYIYSFICVIGKRLCSLHAEGLRLLLMVS